jgi:diguanylate cyclase
MKDVLEVKKNDLLVPWAEPNEEKSILPAVLKAVLIIVLILGSGAFVYLTGGIKYVYSHSIYIAIILGAYFFYIPGGLLAGLIAGLVLGPYMPLNVVTGEMQLPVNWIFRTIIFFIVGGLLGVLFHKNNKQIQKIEWMVYHEVDTGIPNRAELIRYLEGIIQRPKKVDNVALFMVLLNNFKEITNVLNADEINQLNVEIFKRLNYLKEKRSTAYQIFPYIYCLILEDINGTDDYQDIAERFMQTTKNAIVINEVPIFVEVTIGAAIHTSGKLDANQFLGRAKLAAQIAYEKGINFWIYSQQTDAITQKAKKLAGGIVNAMKEKQVSLKYQPILSLQDRSVEGVESLLRWKHPEFGDIPPMEFLPAVEQTAFIYDVHHWVYQEALRALQRWDSFEGYISINLSTRLLVDQSWINDFSAFINEIQTTPSRIIFEVTETAIMNNPESSNFFLEKIKKMGIKIALDDFGTGYSSLSYLQNLPIDIIKIDKSLVRDVHLDTKKQMIAQSIISLSKSMGIKTISEGIENSLEYGWLKNAGCNSAQGYFFAKPLTESGLIKRLMTHE